MKPFLVCLSLVLSLITPSSTWATSPIVQFCKDALGLAGESSTPNVSLELQRRARRIGLQFVYNPPSAPLSEERGAVAFALPRSQSGRAEDGYRSEIWSLRAVSGKPALEGELAIVRFHRGEESTRPLLAVELESQTFDRHDVYFSVGQLERLLFWFAERSSKTPSWTLYSHLDRELLSESFGSERVYLIEIENHAKARESRVEPYLELLLTLGAAKIGVESF